LSFLATHNSLLVSCLDGSVLVWRERTGALDRLDVHDWANEVGEAKLLVDFGLSGISGGQKSILSGVGINRMGGRPVPALVLSVHIRRLINEKYYNRPSRTPPESPRPTRANRNRAAPSFVSAHRRVRTSEDSYADRRSHSRTPSDALSVLTESVKKTSGAGLAALQELGTDMRAALVGVGGMRTEPGPPVRVKTPAKALGGPGSVPEATVRTSISRDEEGSNAIVLQVPSNFSTTEKIVIPEHAPRGSHGSKQTMRPQSFVSTPKYGENREREGPPIPPIVDDTLGNSVLSCLYSWGISERTDSLLEKHGLEKPGTLLSVGMRGAGDFISLPIASAEPGREVGEWAIGPRYTASRLTALLAMVLALLSEKRRSGGNSDDDVLELVTFFCSDGLSLAVGKTFASPSLSFVSAFWQDSVPEVQQAARSVFRGVMATLTPMEKQTLYRKWASRVEDGTTIFADGTRTITDLAIRHTLLLGIVGSEEGDDNLEIQATFMVANNLVTMLSETTKMVYRIAVVEILARGFNTWEMHINSANLIRTFSYLANFLPNMPGAAVSVSSLSLPLGSSQRTDRDSPTEARKNVVGDSGKSDTILPPALVEKARQAVLHVATTKPDLFVSVMTLDLGHAPSMAERVGNLKVLTFIVTKRPTVIYYHLGKILEVVVKLLDPNIPNMRDNLLSTVTLTLQEIVKMYPSVTFQSATQRLAVGDLNGEIVLYDLKTGAPWQILEGTPKAVTIVSFSPDGKTVCSYSAEDATIRFWQPTSNLLGMMFGGRNVSAVKPMRSYRVVFGKDGDPQPPAPSPAQAIEGVRLNWLSERSVKLTGHKGHTQTEIVFAFSGSENYRLLELPTELIPLFESSKYGGSGLDASADARGQQKGSLSQSSDDEDQEESGLIVRGLPNDGLCVVTGDATYSVRGLQFSNSMLILGPQRTDGSRECVTQLSSYMELTQMAPRLERLRKLLAEHVFDGDQDEMDLTDAPALDTVTLGSVTQASDEELFRALRELHAIDIDGHWKILAPPYIKSVLETVLYAAVAADRSLSSLDLGWCVEQFRDSEPATREDVLRHVLQMFSDQVEGDYILKSSKIMPMTKFMDEWRKATPMDFDIDLRLLEGYFVVEMDRFVSHIQYFSKDDLSPEPKDRFRELYSRKQRWEESELLPFIRDLAPDRKKLDALLLKVRLPCSITVLFEGA
ncbi:hypothetical protein HDU93_007254, partial [Gonapodya sp. JEL0774]